MKKIYQKRKHATALGGMQQSGSKTRPGRPYKTRVADSLPKKRGQSSITRELSIIERDGLFPSDASIICYKKSKRSFLRTTVCH